MAVWINCTRCLLLISWKLVNPIDDRQFRHEGTEKETSMSREWSNCYHTSRYSHACHDLSPEMAAYSYWHHFRSPLSLFPYIPRILPNQHASYFDRTPYSRRGRDCLYPPVIIIPIDWFMFLWRGCFHFCPCSLPPSPPICLVAVFDHDFPLARRRLYLIWSTLRQSIAAPPTSCVNMDASYARPVVGPRILALNDTKYEISGMKEGSIMMLFWERKRSDSDVHYDGGDLLRWNEWMETIPHIVVYHDPIDFLRRRY